jgi:hypothetical protein
MIMSAVTATTTPLASWGITFLPAKVLDLPAQRIGAVKPYTGDVLMETEGAAVQALAVRHDDLPELMQQCHLRLNGLGSLGRHPSSRRWWART